MFYVSNGTIYRLVISVLKELMFILGFMLLFKRRTTGRKLHVQKRLKKLFSRAWISSLHTFTHDPSRASEFHHRASGLEG